MSDDPRPPNDDTERVGYCRPPIHSRFKPGNRANPYGRGNRNRDDFAASVHATLAGKVEIRQGRRTRFVTRREALILSLFDKAKRGIVAAANRLLDIYESTTGATENGPMVVEIHNALPNDDGDYADRLIPESGPSNLESPPKDPR